MNNLLETPPGVICAIPWIQKMVRDLDLPEECEEEIKRWIEDWGVVSKQLDEARIFLLHDHARTVNTDRGWYDKLSSIILRR